MKKIIKRVKKYVKHTNVNLREKKIKNWAEFNDGRGWFLLA